MNIHVELKLAAFTLVQLLDLRVCTAVYVKNFWAYSNLDIDPTMPNVELVNLAVFINYNLPNFMFLNQGFD